MTVLLEQLQAQIGRLEARIAQLEGAQADPLIAPGRMDTMAEIALASARAYGIDVADLRGRDRRRALAILRQDAMAAMKRAGFSTTQIGRYFDGRDHTTVLHAVRMAEKRLAIR